jgi:hypothetical protein
MAFADGRCVSLPGIQAAACRQAVELGEHERSIATVEFSPTTAARFLIADLSHGNPGAYWEAGFAEGLNLPVIYTCEAGAWSKSKTHFDTNHMATIIWNETELDQAGKALTAMIRATLRAEAKPADDGWRCPATARSSSAT